MDQSVRASCAIAQIPFSCSIGSFVVPMANLGTLALALDSDEVSEPLQAFVQASSKATNTLANRTIRFRYYCMANWRDAS